MVDVGAVVPDKTDLPPPGEDNDGPTFAHQVLAVVGDHNTPSPEQDLRDAAAEGDIEKMKVILNSNTKFDINAKNPKDGKTALHYAATAEGNVNEAVELLLSKGADLTIKDKDGKTAYQIAIEKAEEDHDNPDGTRQKTPIILSDKAKDELQTAFKLGAWDRAIALIKGYHGIDPSARYQYSGEKNVSLLSFAAGAGKLDVVKALVERVDQKNRAEFINSKGARGRTAMHSAAEGGHSEVYNYLKDNGGKEDIKSDDGNTPYKLLTGEDLANYGPPRGDWKRPVGDTRSAQKIIEQNPALRGLAPNLKDWLKNGFGDGTPFKGVGDYEKDADAAYRASEMIKHIQNFDVNGARITGDSTNDGHLDGFFEEDGKLVANPHTEAARFQDFTKYGWDYLKGGHRPPPPKTPPAVDEKRPAGDTRSTQQIWDDNPLLKNLGKAEKDKLKEKVGDLYRDPDAAWRAARVLEHIEHYGPDGRINDPDTIGNYQIDGFFKGKNGLEANPHTEAARLQDFFKKKSPQEAFDYLKTFNASVEEKDYPKAPENKLDLSKPPEGAVEFGKWLRDAAQQKSVQGVGGEFDRREMLKDPTKFTPEQRARAAWELKRGLDLYMAGVEHNNAQFTLYEGLGEYSTDPEQFVTTVSSAIELIESSPAVKNWQSEKELAAVKDILKDEGLKSKAQAAFKDMTEKAVGFDAMFEDKDAGGFMGLAIYSSQVEFLNKALGNETMPFIKLDGNSKHHAEVQKLISNDFGNPNRLKDLMKGVDGMPPMSAGEAIAWLSTRAQTYGYYSSNKGIADMQGNLAAMSVDVGLDNLDNDKIKELILNSDGGIDEKKLKDYFLSLKEQEALPFFAQDTSVLDNVVKAMKDGFDYAKSKGYVDLGQWLKDLTKMEGLTTNADGTPRDESQLSDQDKQWLKTMRETGAFTDKSGKPQPQIRTLFKYGVPHAAGGALGALGLAIVSAKNGADEPKEILFTAGATLGVMGAGIEHYERNARLYGWGYQFNAEKGPQGDWTRPYQGDTDIRGPRPNAWKTASDPLRHYDALRNGSKTFLSGPGGALFGGFLLMEGASRLASGDKTGAGLYLAAGGVTGLAGLNTIIDGGISISTWVRSLGTKGMNYADLAENVILKFGKFGKILTKLIWPLDLALLGYEIFTDHKKNEALHDWMGKWQPYLDPYDVTGFPGNIHVPEESEPISGS